MPVDVTTTLAITRPRDKVASYAMDPQNATTWYKNIESVELVTPAPLAIGSRMAFRARFLGRALVYTYEVVKMNPGQLLVMRTTDGPFPMETTYQFDDGADGETMVTLRNRGEPVGFSRLAAPFIAPAMRRANRDDLRRLKAALEAEVPNSDP